MLPRSIILDFVKQYKGDCIQLGFRIVELSEERFQVS